MVGEPECALELAPGRPRPGPGAGLGTHWLGHPLAGDAPAPAPGPDRSTAAHGAGPDLGGARTRAVPLGPAWRPLGVGGRRLQRRLQPMGGDDAAAGAGART